MGGLRKKMPHAPSGRFLIGTLALAGIPPLAGFWSKDEILAHALEEFVHQGVVSWPFFVWLLLTLAAFLTAFYMGRQVFLTFFGKPRSHDAMHAHESPNTMTYPLIILAVFAALLGFVGMPEEFPVLGQLLGDNPCHRFVGHAYPCHAAQLAGDGHLASCWRWAACSWAGWSTAASRWRRASLIRCVRAWGRCTPVLQNKYYVDELYKGTVIRFVLWLSRDFASGSTTSWVIDPIVNLVGKAGVLALRRRRLLRHAIGRRRGQRRGGRHRLGRRWLRMTQTGQVQNYLLVRDRHCSACCLALWLYLPILLMSYDLDRGGSVDEFPDPVDSSPSCRCWALIVRPVHAQGEGADDQVDRDRLSLVPLVLSHHPLAQLRLGPGGIQFEEQCAVDSGPGRQLPPGRRRHQRAVDLPDRAADDAVACSTPRSPSTRG